MRLYPALSEQLHLDSAQDMTAAGVVAPAQAAAKPVRGLVGGCLDGSGRGSENGSLRP